MRGAPKNSDDPPALLLIERGVCRDERSQIDGLEVDVVLGGEGHVGLRLSVDSSDPFHDVISDALENDLDAPYLRSVRYSRATEAIAQRGRAQAASLTAILTARAPSLATVGALNVVGTAKLFDQTWEAIHFAGKTAPFAINQPVVRVVAGATPYSATFDAHGLRVTVLSARRNWKTDIPPRQVTRALRDLQDKWESFKIGVTTPAYPNEIEADILPARGIDDPRAGAPILHVDAHGVLLSYDQLMQRYGATRASFVAESWGIEVTPYGGLKGFVMINSLTSEGELTEMPVSGEELAGLCRQAGIPLVVLNACQAASDAAEGGFAADLVSGGVPDVIAFRHVVMAGSATLFVSALYGALVHGASVAQACCFARGTLYRHGVIMVPKGALPFPDWISVVHYSARPATPEPMPAAIADIKLTNSPPELPVALEWATLKVQDLIYQIRMARAVPDAHGLPSPRPIILFGPIGAGAESLMWETTRWLANTDLQISGATLLDVGLGLEPALEPYIPGFDLGWSDERIVETLVKDWGPHHAVGFHNLDLALDREQIDAEGYRRIMRVAAMLAKRTGVCLVHSSRNLYVERFAGALGVDVLGLNCWPVATKEVEDWLVVDREVDDPDDRVVTTLLAWISGGYVDVAGVTSVCSTPEQREILLEHFVFGTRVLNPPHELWIQHQQVLARWAVARRSADIDPLIPLVAGLASGIFTDELADVGRDLHDQEFPLIPRLSVDDLLPLQTALLVNGLLSDYTGKAPPGWETSEGRRYALLRLNPFLRPLARMNLSPEVRDELDRWTVAWAADKVDFFSREWLDPTNRPQTGLYIEHAWPLFAVAICIARRATEQAGRLRAAIDRAQYIGWWPRALDVATLFGDDALADAKVETSEFDRLWKRAVNLQLQGDRSGARDLLFLAIESVGGEAGGYPYYAAQYRLGTISIDMGEIDQAAEHLKIAAEGAAHDFVAPNTHAFIIYEQGVVARRRGRDKQAVERFRASIAQAQKLGLHELLCLNYQELTDMELRHVPAFVLDGREGIDLGADWANHVAQADIYLSNARNADKAARATEGSPADPSPEEGRLLLLEARLLAVRSMFGEAHQKTLEAMDAFRQWNDPRVEFAGNFLYMLDAVIAGLCGSDD